MNQSIDEETKSRMMEVARAAADQAYVPYSHFPVGAAILTADDTIIPGCNVENASFGLTNCAERTAIFTAAAAGHRQVRAVAVTAPGAPGTTPCGACRQVLREFTPAEGMLILIDHAGEVAETTLEALLPDSFGPERLAGNT
ncbi:MAG: cytidine deaminase [Thermomicrobiales bacterium]|jgi:cytidine deaminase